MSTAPEAKIPAAMSRVQQVLSKMFVASAVALLATPSAWAGIWYVNVDTQAIAGLSGWVDFQFNPADASAPAGHATVSAFGSVAPLLPGATSSGDVAGGLGSTLTLGNSQLLNDWLQGYVFGSTLSFTVEIDVPLANASGAGTAFSFSLYDSNFNNLLADPAWGAALVINAADSGALEVLAQSAPVSLSDTPPANAVPESATAWLSMWGLLMIGWRQLGRATSCGCRPCSIH